MSGYTNGWTDKISRVHGYGRVVYAAGYILYSQRRFFTRRELASYLTQPLLASAAVDRQIIRSRPIKGVPPRRVVRVHTSAVHLFSRVMELSYIPLARDTSIMPNAPFRGHPPTRIIRV